MEGRRLRRDVLRALMASRWRSWFADTDAECGFWSVILAHHGTLPAHDAPRSDPRLWRGRDGYDPLASLEVVAEILADMFSRRAFAPDHDHLPDRSRFQHAFAGLVTLADWLGSDGTVFGSEREGAPSGRSRVRWARQQAAALMNRRWFDPGRAREAAAQCSMDFGTLFPHVPAPRTPRPAQVALLEASLPRPGQVTVLEAETGSGKTEAALIHFLRLFRASEVDGLYFALPTRAAAVQIHRRIRQTLGGWLGAAAPPVGLAVPGYLRADDHEGERLPQSFDVLWPDEADRDRTWALENAKRYLSGAVMVGTVDQLLMGGLRVGHAPFRSGPMLRLPLCVDEVHASDAYMTELLRNVLDQHRAAGGHAILMSATLGSLARLRLLGGRVEAHQAADAVRAAAEPYPSMQTSGGELQALPGDRRAACEKRVAVEVLNPEMDDGPLLARLKAAAAGAAVLFIRNRVDDARRTVQQLEEIGSPLLRCRGRTAPHHGRFAPEDRRLLDDALERALSPRESRDGVVAVTTQTAEQSLDIDADWLVTDIAPGDVLPAADWPAASARPWAGGGVRGATGYGAGAYAGPACRRAEREGRSSARAYDPGPREGLPEHRRDPGNARVARGAWPDPDSRRQPSTRRDGDALRRAGGVCRRPIAWSVASSSARCGGQERRRGDRRQGCGDRLAPPPRCPCRVSQVRLTEIDRLVVLKLLTLAHEGAGYRKT